MDTPLLAIVVALIVVAAVFVLRGRRRADARAFGSSATGGAAIVSGTEGGVSGVHGCTGAFAGRHCGGDGGGGGD